MNWCRSESWARFPAGERLSGVEEGRHGLKYYLVAEAGGEGRQVSTGSGGGRMNKP